MGSVLYTNGKIGSHGCPTYKLAEAAFWDDYASVAELLRTEPSIDCNATVALAKCCVGTPLALTGRRDIAEMLVAHGADVTLACQSACSDGVTPIASAVRSLKYADLANLSLSARAELLYLIEYLGQQLREKALASHKPSKARKSKS